MVQVSARQTSGGQLLHAETHRYASCEVNLPLVFGRMQYIIFPVSDMKILHAHSFCPRRLCFWFGRLESISRLPNLFGGTPRICNCILLLIMWVRSFSKRLPSVTFVEEKVLIFVILREKC